MGGIGRISRRPFQFLRGRSKRGFGAFSLRAILLRIQREFLHGCREPERYHMACDETASQEQRACGANLPAEAMQLSHRIGEGINANFVGGWKEWTRVKPLVKQELRCAIFIEANAVFVAIGIRDRAGYLFV